MIITVMMMMMMIMMMNLMNCIVNGACFHPGFGSLRSDGKTPKRRYISRYYRISGDTRRRRE